MVSQKQKRVALLISSAVFTIYYLLLVWMSFLGILLKFSASIPGLHYAVAELGLIGTPAVVPGILTYLVLYAVFFLLNLRHIPKTTAE